MSASECVNVSTSVLYCTGIVVVESSDFVSVLLSVSRSVIVLDSVTKFVVEGEGVSDKVMVSDPDGDNSAEREVVDDPVRENVMDSDGVLGTSIVLDDSALAEKDNSPVRDRDCD